MAQINIQQLTDDELEAYLNERHQVARGVRRQPMLLELEGVEIEIRANENAIRRGNPPPVNARAREQQQPAREQPVREQPAARVGVAEVAHNYGYFDRAVNPPTSDVGAIRQICRDFVQQNRQALVGKEIRMNLYFHSKAIPPYTSGFMTFTEFQRQENNRFTEMIDQWAAQQMNYDDDLRWKVNRVELIVG